MNCTTCEQTRKDFYCTSCLSKEYVYQYHSPFTTLNEHPASLRQHHTALKQFTTERDALVATAAAALSTLHAARGRRADAAGLRDRLDDIQTHARMLRTENEHSQCCAVLTLV